MGEVTIYHNPRCSKSRQTLALARHTGNHPARRALPRHATRCGNADAFAEIAVDASASVDANARSPVRRIAARRCYAHRRRTDRRDGEPSSAHRAPDRRSKRTRRHRQAAGKCPADHLSSVTSTHGSSNSERGSVRPHSDPVLQPTGLHCRIGRVHCTRRFGTRPFRAALAHRTRRCIDDGENRAADSCRRARSTARRRISRNVARSHSAARHDSATWRRR